jgi:hypothetical protein
MMAPAASSVRTTRAVRDGTWSPKIEEPYVVRMPAVSNRSLTASGTPASGPVGRRTARRSAWSGQVVMKA